MPWLFEAKKDVISCDKPRGFANKNWSVDFRMGQPTMATWYPAMLEANPGNWNISLPGGKENNSDSLSSGDRTGKSLNHACFGKGGVVGLRCMTCVRSGNALERRTIGSESLVHVITREVSSTLSRAGHEESCLNLPGPSGKAKYYKETDSEPVLWRKGEKHPEQGSEIVPETVRLQAVGATSCGDGVPFA